MMRLDFLNNPKQKIFILSIVVSLLCNLQCGLVESDHSYSAKPLTLTYYDQKVWDSPIKLAEFDIEWENAVSLRNVKMADVHIKSTRLGYACQSNDNIWNEDILFLLLIDKNSNQVWDFMLSPNPYASGRGEMYNPPAFCDLEGRIYCFFIEGIGMRPESPVHVLISADNINLDIEVLPEENTIPNTFVHHIDSNSIGFEYGESSLSFEVNTNSNSLPYLPFLLIYVDSFWMEYVFDTTDITNVGGRNISWGNLSFPFFESYLYLLQL